MPFVSCIQTDHFCRAPAVLEQLYWRSCDLVDENVLQVKYFCINYLREKWVSVLRVDIHSETQGGGKDSAETEAWQTWCTVDIPE